MRRRFAWSAVVLWSAGAFVACATYSDLSLPTDEPGDAGAPTSGMTASQGGSAAGTSSEPSAGKTSTAGKSNGGAAGSEVVAGGAAGAGGGSVAGSGGSVAGSGGSVAGSGGGKAGAGGAAGMAGSGGSAGGGGAGGSGGTGGKGGAAGMAGAGGSGPAPCSSTAPDASCSCVPNAAHDYWFCTTYLTFAAAEAKCVAVKMHLPEVETQAEDSFIYTTSVAKTLGEFYLGATDAATPNTWLWLAGGMLWQGVANGTPTGYTHWNGGEPNDSGDCLVVETGGPWDDRICTDQRRYICEAP